MTKTYYDMTANFQPHELVTTLTIYQSYVTKQIPTNNYIHHTLTANI